MSDDKDGGPAFPLAVDPDRHASNDGMTLRDYFAAHAPFTLADVMKHFDDNGVSGKTYRQAVNTLAAMRMEYAEAMIAARLMD